MTNQVRFLPLLPHRHWMNGLSHVLWAPGIRLQEYWCFLRFENVSNRSPAQPRLRGDGMVVHSHLCVLGARTTRRHGGGQGLRWCATSLRR